MSKITINGENFDGNEVEINEERVTVDGNEKDVNLSNGIDISTESKGEDVNVNIKSNGTTIKVRQTSKTGENKMSISF